MREGDLLGSIGSSLCSSSLVLFIAAFGYVPLSEVSMLSEGFVTLPQLLYWCGMASLLPNPGFTVIAFVSVSTAHVFLLHIHSGPEY